MSTRRSVCPDCEGDSAVSRRDFIRVASAGTAAAAAMGPAILRAADEKADKTPETLTKKFYDSLSEKQRAAVCFDWDYVDSKRNFGTLRTRVANNWHITPQTINSDFYTKDQRELAYAIWQGIIHPDWHARVQKQIEAGLWGPAMQSLEEMLPMSRWIPMMRGQLLAQMGMLAYQGGDSDKAMALLEGASLRAGDARLLLACIHYRKGDQKRAMEILRLATTVNKKHALMHNTFAWMLNKAERADEAQALLAALLKRDPSNAPTKDNLLRLQNRTRLSMQAFDAHWYALGLEQPPQQMGQMRRAPKGFREPPKRRGR